MPWRMGRFISKNHITQEDLWIYFGLAADMV